MKDGFRLLEDVVKAKFANVHFNSIMVSKEFYMKLMDDEKKSPGSSFMDIKSPGDMPTYAGVPLSAGPKDQEEDYILTQG